MSEVQVANNRINRQLQVQPFTPIPKQFFIGQLTASSTTLYTAPAAPTVSNPTGSNPKAIIKCISICNTDSAARTVTLYLIESAGAVADNRAITKAVSVPANETWILDNVYYVMEASSTLRGLASITNVVTICVSGDELL